MEVNCLNKAEKFNQILENFKAKDNSVFSFRDSMIVKGDSLELMKYIPDNSISLVLTDPPYHSTKKKNIAGDTAFKKDKDFLDWMNEYAKEWHRILKPNGSVYCFCSSQMQSRLEVMFSEYFNILSSITWTKPNRPGYDGWKNKMKKENLRQWYPHSERIIFMEPKYEGNLFQSYFGIKLRQWRKKLRVSGHELTELTGEYGKVNHGGAVSNWEAGRNIPSKEQYKKIVSVLKMKDDRNLINFPEYEDIIRPFFVTKDSQYTDIWTFENVRQHKGKHPAEKPVDLLENAISASSYEGDIVLDTFGGSGATAIAASKIKRRSIVIEIEDKWVEYSANRMLSLF